MRRPSYSSHCPALILIFLLGLILVPPQLADAQKRGYRIAGNQIIVNSPAHWERWSMPIHAVNILPSGGVHPHFSRSRFNVLDDLETYNRRLPELRRKKGQTVVSNIDSTETLDVFGNVIRDRKKNPLYTHLSRIGISRVGSNPRAAANILDGDPNTFWEPDFNDSIEDWWVEVDLGRSLPVDELVLNFVDESLGDPFRQFRILSAPFQKVLNHEVNEIPFRREGGTKGSNEDQRVFSFQLDQFQADDNWIGETVQVIRIVVTDSKFGRGQLISEEEWSALNSADRGDVVYFVRNQRGFEEPVEKSVYDNLPPERQGKIEHYIRERPRLADIQVWGFGDNLSPGLVEGGGSAAFHGANDSFSPAPAFDGDGGSNFIHLVWSPTVDRGVLFVD
ncbi:MAG: discoidin domain-containing protein, partial [Gemmatimonadota bacterium]|nr:discoidin domain-containing protein [Gemmatimonadota bacterium]